MSAASVRAREIIHGRKQIHTRKYGQYLCSNELGEQRYAKNPGFIRKFGIWFDKREDRHGKKEFWECSF